MFFYIFGGICSILSLISGIIACVSSQWAYGVTLIITAVFAFTLLLTLNSLTEKVEKLEKQVSELKNSDKKDS